MTFTVCEAYYNSVSNKIRDILRLYFIVKLREITGLYIMHKLLNKISVKKTL